jgi:hypothetical protein
MFARVTTSIAPKEKIEALNKYWKEIQLPSVKKEKGYKGLLFINNPENGEQLLISLWDTEADMLAHGKKSSTLDRAKQAKAEGVNIIGTKSYTVGIKD